MLAFAHRGGAYHPEIEGLENTTARLPARRRPRLPLPRDRRPRHPRRRAAGLPRQRPRPGHRPAGRDRRADRTPRSRPRWSAAASRCPRLAELLEAFPDARFNIDLKSAGRGRPAGRPRRPHAAPRTGCCVGSFSERRPAPVPRGSARRPGRRPSAGRSRSSARSRSCPAATARRLLARRRRGAPGPPPAAGRWRRRPPALVRRAHAAGRHVHVWTVDERAEMEQLLDLGVDGLITDRTDVLRDVLVERGQWEGTRDHRPGIADLEPLDRRARAAGLVLVRLGELAPTSPRSPRVLFAPYLTAVAERPPAVATTDDSTRATGTSTSLGVGVSAGSLVVLRRHRLDDPVGAACCPSSARWPTGPRARSELLGGFAWAGAAVREPDVPGRRRRLAARRRRCSCVANVLFLGARLVVYDSILCRHRDAGRARPGLLARLGVRLPRRRPAARAQLRRCVTVHEPSG